MLFRLFSMFKNFICQFKKGRFTPVALEHFFSVILDRIESGEFSE